MPKYKAKMVEIRPNISIKGANNSKNK